MAQKQLDHTSKETQGEWFESWFNSPYYHLLYRHRDEAEARKFIDTLLTHLRPRPQAAMLDVACGKGRHSRYLAEQGYYVTGIDLSIENINFARRFESERLSFYTHDMRLIFRINYFDFVFNFFTSFGYFRSDKDHLNTLKNLYLGLKPGGCLVLDFLNAELAVHNLLAEKKVEIEGIQFLITSSYQSGYLHKRICVTDREQHLHFEEQVRAFQLADFERLFEKAGLQIEHLFGNYQLDPFDVQSSDRLILFAKKNPA